jgi:lipoprotein signal peptidase
MGLYNGCYFIGAIVSTCTFCRHLLHLMLTENIGLTYGIINDTNGEINWRIPMATQGVPCIVVLVFVWFLPESPRWLMSRGRTLEARNILAK